jgi:hypothetical protein
VGGAQGGKKSIDRGSGSGVFGRDPDLIMDIAPLEVPEKRAAELGTTSCWRIDATLREFGSIPAPIDVFYRFPMHVLDRQGELAKMSVEGKQEDWKSKRERGQRNKAMKDEANQAEKVALVETALASCTDAGIPPTIANMLERIGEFGGEKVTEGQLKSWTNQNGSPWTPFKRVVDKRFGRAALVVDTRDGGTGEDPSEG